jgi:hypothetical protein
MIATISEIAVATALVVIALMMIAVPFIAMFLVLFAG